MGMELVAEGSGWSKEPDIPSSLPICERRALGFGDGSTHLNQGEYAI